MAAARLTVTAETARALLTDWARLNEALMGMTLADVQLLLKLEIGGRRRTNFLLRLYGRYHRLRADVERAALINEGVLPWKVP